jgi:hypothetical protein
MIKPRRMRWIGQVGERECREGFDGKRTLGRPRRSRLEDNVKTDLKK